MSCRECTSKSILYIRQNGEGQSLAEAYSVCKSQRRSSSWENKDKDCFPRCWIAWDRKIVSKEQNTAYSLEGSITDVSRQEIVTHGLQV